MPELRGTVAETYLLSRGIDLAKLGRQPQALRFYRSLKHHKSNSYWPALVSLIHGPDGKHCAVHRTWLAPDGHAKAPLGGDARMVLGPYAGGAIRIWRGAGGRPIGQAPPGSAVTLTEGIEDGLTVAVSCPERRVLACVSISNMGELMLPPAIGHVTIAADNDAAGSAAAGALDRAVARFINEGRVVAIARCETGHDINDLLRGGEVMTEPRDSGTDAVRLIIDNATEVVAAGRRPRTTAAWRAIAR